MVENQMERMIVGAMKRRKLSYEKLGQLWEKKSGQAVTKQAVNQKVKNLCRTKNLAKFREVLEVIGVSEKSIEEMVAMLK